MTQKNDAQLNDRLRQLIDEIEEEIAAQENDADGREHLVAIVCYKLLEPFTHNDYSCPLCEN